MKARPAMTNTQADHYYVQALQAAHDTAHIYALDALHTEALADDAALAATRTARAAQIAATIAAKTHTTTGLPRADWLDDQIISGMFIAMTHREIHDEYGLQEIIIATGDYADMFNLR